MSDQLGHSGSWSLGGINLPDFTITEKIGDLLGGNRTAEGGSNVTNKVGKLPTAQVMKDGKAQVIQGPGLGWSGTGDVVKPTSSGVTPKPVTNQSSATETSSLPDWGRGEFEGQEVGSGGYIWKWNSKTGTWQQVRQDTSGQASSGGGDGKLPNGASVKDPNANPGPDYFWDAADGWKPVSSPTPAYTGPSDEELNTAYKPLLDVLAQAEQLLGTTYGQQQQNIESQVRTARQLADEQKRVAEQTIGQNDLLGARRRDDVISAARKLFQELQTANQQRFGGASSAGQAASELQGREFMGISGKARQGYADLVSELNNKSLEVNNNYSLALQQLEDKKAAALSQAQNDFQNSLLQISQQKAGIESEKAQRRLAALEQYRQEVNAINQQQNQFAQQLQMMKAQSDIQLDNYAKQLAMAQHGAGQSLQNYISDPTLSSVLSPTTQKQISSTYQGGFNQIDPALLQQLQGMVAGQTNRRNDLTNLYGGLSNIQSMAR